ncbi:MAG TPA: hypothetical protein VLE74_04400 [Candidatus Saccharimonadales bacterium]|nr:hypothetical protein [Candidatus Saccharimonadales bacterium]
MLSQRSDSSPNIFRRHPYMFGIPVGVGLIAARAWVLGNTIGQDSAGNDFSDKCDVAVKDITLNHETLSEFARLADPHGKYTVEFTFGKIQCVNPELLLGTIGLKENVQAQLPRLDG